MHSIFSMRLTRILTTLIPLAILMGCGEGEGKQPIAGTPAPPPPPPPPASCNDFVGFEDVCPAGTFTEFEGGVAFVVDNPDASGINTSAKVAEMQKFGATSGATFGGTTFALPTALNVTAGSSFTMKVWSQRAVQVLFQPEPQGPGSGVEVMHGGSGWEELTFSLPAISGTVAGITIIFDNGTLGAADTDPTNWTFYVDEITLVAPGGGGGGGATTLPADFEGDVNSYDFGPDGGFEGGAASVIANPDQSGINTSAQVGQMQKFPGEVFGGATLVVDPITVTAGSSFTMKVWSQRSVPVLLQPEPQGPGTGIEVVHGGTGWEELTFALPGLSGTVSGLTIIFDNGTAGAADTDALNWTFYFDDIALVPPGGGGGGGSFTPITFDDAATTYALRGFGGAEDSSVQADPAGGSNMVVRVNRAADAATFAGTVISTGANESVPVIPLDAQNTTMNVRVYSPAAGLQVRLKVENSNDDTISVETEATTTVANAWETLTFDFTVATTPPTAAFDPAATYDKVIIFFNFGIDGATAGAQTFYFDDIDVGAGGGGGGSGFTPITFDDAGTTYTLTGFGGAEDSTVEMDPAGGSNMVGRAFKSATAELWAGTTVSTEANEAIPTIPLDAANTQMTVRVYSPVSGIPVRLKIEDASDATLTVETEAMTTGVDTWETLTFDFANQAAGTAAFDAATTYNKVSIFFNFGTDGASGGGGTFYFDDIDVSSGGGGGGGGGSAPTSTDFEGAGPFNFSDFDGGVATVISNPDASGINTSATVGQMQKFAGQPWGGSTLDLGGSVDWSAGEVYTMKVRSPRVVDVLLKLEGLNQERTATHGGTGWEELCFDFTGATGGAAATAITLIFDNGVMGDAAGDPTNWTFQFDDIQQAASCPTGGGGGFAAITFDDPGTTYTLTDFGGNASTVTNDPAGGTNMVVQATKSNSAQVWAGTTVSTEANDSVPVIPLGASNTQMTVRVYSPDAGIPVRLKIEDASAPAVSVETEAMTTVANAWETLTFDFANEAAGTTAFDSAATYNKVSIFFNFGTDGATAGEKTYYFDDVDVVAGGGSGGGGSGYAAVTFDDSALTYTLTGFGGAEDSTVVVDPAGGSNMVGRAFKSDTAQLWAGTTVSTGANESIPALPLDATNTQMTVRVYSPVAGIPVRLKIEDASAPAVAVETEAMTTGVNTWETLTFDFANEAAGTTAFNPAATYNKASIFFNFGTDGASGGGGTFYFDDIDVAAGGGGGGGGGGTGGSGGFVNGDFETGDFTGWTLFQDPPTGGSIAVDSSGQGGRAGTVARLTAAGSDVIGTNDVIIGQVALAAGTVMPGDSIDVSFDLYGSLTGAGGVVFVEVIFLDASGQDNGRNFVGPAAPYTPTNAWTPYSGTVIAGTTVGGGSASVAGGVTLELKAACGAIAGGCGVDASFDNVTFTIN
ncbi:MAG: hypothetical protein K0U72_03480 [Gammaproteobacteria bacterium]|nr:hypothetical protein [Gammaproteobacteria bacterium]